MASRLRGFGPNLPVYGIGFLSVSLIRIFTARMELDGENPIRLIVIYCSLKTIIHVTATSYVALGVLFACTAAKLTFMLSGGLHVHGEAAEQLGARQDLITCKPLIAAIGSLVWDADKATLKRGFRGSGPGSARRVQFVAKQFRLTYDLDSMPQERILDLLPREFDRFRHAGGPPGRRPPGLNIKLDARDRPSEGSHPSTV